jgi:hypothetical protein
MALIAWHLLPPGQREKLKEDLLKADYFAFIEPFPKFVALGRPAVKRRPFADLFLPIFPAQTKNRRRKTKSNLDGKTAEKRQK